MMTQETLLDLLGSAYDLYDFVALRSHPLAALLVGDLPAKERGWKVHQLLLELIEEIAPSHDAPEHLKEVRRYRLMQLRYVDALEPMQVAQRLAISRRQYYREQTSALEAIADILKPRLSITHEPAPVEKTLAEKLHDLSELMSVLQSVVQSLQRILTEHAIHVEIVPNDARLMVHVKRDILRQALMAMMGHLAQHMRNATLQLPLNIQASSLTLEMIANDDVLKGDMPLWWDEIAAMMDGEQAQLHYIRPHHFSLVLPIVQEQTILVVDDNVDMLELYERYLTPYGYHVLQAASAALAIELAQRSPVHCILVDLMMPEQDGWELLQSFGRQAATATVPIIVCSVLKQRDLALALGAAAFLGKPFTQHDLLNTIQSLAKTEHS